jgi:hypothetical protein
MTGAYLLFGFVKLVVADVFLSKLMYLFPQLMRELGLLQM